MSAYWIEAAQKAVTIEVETGGGVKQLLAFVRQHCTAVKAVPAPGRDPWAALAARHGWADQQCAAFAWLVGVLGGKARVALLSHSDAASKHSVVLVGDREVVVDVSHGHIFLNAKKRPATLAELKKTPKLVAAVKDPWKGLDGVGLEGFFRA